jgi:hypothetical protein
MARPRHPNKEIEAAVRFADTQGWRWVKGMGHCWGRHLCEHSDRDGCILSVWSTPKSAENHAAALRRTVNRCPHKTEENADENA